MAYCPTYVGGGNDNNNWWPYVVGKYIAGNNNVSRRGSIMRCPSSDVDNLLGEKSYTMNYFAGDINASGVASQNYVKLVSNIYNPSIS